MEQLFLTGEEVATMFQTSIKWVQKHSHRIPGRTKVGRLVRYQASAIKKAIAGGNLLNDSKL